MGSLMPRPVARLVAVAALAAVWACEPLTGPVSRVVPIVLEPSFAPAANNQESGINPASLVDNIRVLFEDADGATVLDTVIAWPTDQDTLYAEVSIEVTGEQSFRYTVEARQGEDILFSFGPVDVTLSVDDDPDDPVELKPELGYVGPGATAATLELTAPATVVAGGTAQVAATARDAGGTTVENTPVVWSSLDPDAATVDADGVVTGGSDLSRTAMIVGRIPYVDAADTVSMQVVPAAVDIAVPTDTINAISFSLRLTAVARDAVGAATTGGTVSWSSLDPAIAFVAQTGIDSRRAWIVATALGTARIVASIGAVTDTTSVLVRQVPASAAVAPGDLVMGVNDTSPLTGVLVDSAGVTIAGGAPFAWSVVGGAAAAIVASDGTVTAQAIGAAEIQGTANGFTASTNVTVTAVGSNGVAVGDEHACRLDANGQVWCWGRGTEGQLGDGSFADASLPQAAAGGVTFMAVSAGSRHTCGLALDGTAYCWGSNDAGQLGDGTVTGRGVPVAVATALKFTAIAAGGQQTCALESDGTAHCWGDNGVGQAGDGVGNALYLTPNAVAGGLSFKALAAGWLHTCGLTTADAAYCWGRGGEGQLGDGAATPSNTPVAVAGGLAFADISAGAAHACAVTTGNALYCWGYNSAGQIGDGTSGSATTPVAVAGGDSYAAVASGWAHTCGALVDGTVKCWGSNASLQFGRASPLGSRTPLTTDLVTAPAMIGAGGLGSCAISGTTLSCWGGVPPERLNRGGGS